MSIMVDLSNLPKTTKRGKKRIGRGKRGARGAKSGRGTKGALKRGKMPLYFEGGALPLTKRIPMLRGKSKNKPLKEKPVIINVEELNRLRSGSVVTKERLIEEGLVKEKEAKRYGIKILGRGKLEKVIKIEGIKISAGAKKKIEAVGGEIRS